MAPPFNLSTALVLGVLGLVVPFMGSIIVSRIGARSTREGQQLQNDLNWRQQLEAEMDKLQQRMEKLQAQFDAKDSEARAMGGFLDELGLFELYGSDEQPHPELPDNAGPYFNTRVWMRVRDTHNARAERLRAQQAQAQTQQ